VLLVTHEAGETGLPGAAAYAAAHAAAISLGISLAEELRPRGIGLDVVIIGRAEWTDSNVGGTLVAALDDASAVALGRLAVELLAAPTSETGRVVRLREWMLEHA
jgi:NAD(P)-dependent dehydrogenase (short-subunit alcohol dehydrogenase family)